MRTRATIRSARASGWGRAPRAVRRERTRERALSRRRLARAADRRHRCQSRGAAHATRPARWAGRVILSDVPAAQHRCADRAGTGRVRARSGSRADLCRGREHVRQAGLRRSAVERLLPVRFQGKRKRRDLDLVLLIDRSHSMRGTSWSSPRPRRWRPSICWSSSIGSRWSRSIRGPMGGAARRGRRQASRRGSDRQHDLERADQHLRRAGAMPSSCCGLHRGHQAHHPAVRRCHRAAARDARARAPTARKRRRRYARRAPRRSARSAARWTADPRRSRRAAGGMEGVVAELAAGEGDVVHRRDRREAESRADARPGDGGNGRSYVAASDAEIPGLFVAETRRLLGEAIVEEPFRPRRRAARVHRRRWISRPARRCAASWCHGLKRFSEVLLQAVAGSRCWCRPTMASARRWRSCPTSRIAGPRTGWAGRVTGTLLGAGGARHDPTQLGRGHVLARIRAKAARR